MTLLSLLVDNHFGVLTKVTGLFSRRGFNIAGLSVGETENPALSRITIQTETDDTRQMCLQLQKLEDVRRAFPLPEDGTVARELLLVKVPLGTNPSQYDERFQTSLQGFEVQTLYQNEEIRILSFAGGPAQTAAFLAVLEGFPVIELCRTGITAMSAARL